MSYYEIIPDSDTFHSLLLRNRKDNEIYYAFDGRSLADSWKPLPVKIYRAEKEGDFPQLVLHIPVFSPKALKVLSPLIEGTAEVLPLDCPNREFYAINVLAVLDCLDVERSEIVKISTGKIMDILRYTFVPDRIGDANIFKVRELPLRNVFVSERFKSAVENSGLEGIKFSKVD